MVYHEIRKKNGKKLNYLVQNKRIGKKWVKKSKFIGTGEISKKKIKELRKEFEREIIIKKKYTYLKKKDVAILENLRETYYRKIKELKKEEYEQFQKTFFTELTYNSNAIEGNSLSLEETSLVINEGVVPEGKTLREIYEAKNHLEAIKFTKSYKGDLTENFILKLHSIILKNISNRFAGKYRETTVRIFGSNVKFLQSDKVPQLMKNLIYRYKKNKSKYHPFELAIIVSMEFVTIHPFIDGNGRMSRLIMNFLLDKKNYPWINVYNKQRQKYLQTVRKANDEDYSLIFPFLISTLEKNLRDFDII
ncbi:MAG: Fic family protein [Nanoarchaeota archaeon]|nr:Fic family protein [Nanoarchaeota archaeon]